MVVARRVEQLHGGSAVRVPASLDLLPEVACGGGGGEPEFEQLLHEMRARRRRVALPIRDDRYGLLARRALLHELDVRSVLEVAGALDQVVQRAGLDVLIPRRPMRMGLVDEGAPHHPIAPYFLSVALHRARQCDRLLAMGLPAALAALQERLRAQKLHLLLRRHLADDVLFEAHAERPPVVPPHVQRADVVDVGDGALLPREDRGVGVVAFDHLDAVAWMEPAVFFLHFNHFMYLLLCVGQSSSPIGAMNLAETEGCRDQVAM